MKLREVLVGVKIKKITGSADKEITGVENRSKNILRGNIFVAIVGKDFDGHDYVAEAERYGAAAVVVERETDTLLTQIIVEDSRESLSVLAANFYGHPDKKIKIIGVTGTNGKTTTTHLIKSIMDGAGIKCGVIGTLGAKYGNKFIPPTLTTPDPVSLYKIFAEMNAAGVEVIALEVSAHALFFDKTAGIKFEVGVFTNFTQDHLDFFGDMESYKNAKMKMFLGDKCKYAVINSDDETGLKIPRGKGQTVYYGIENPADVFAVNLKNTDKGTYFIINLFDCIYDIKLKLKGVFNVYNALAAATACALLSVPTEDVAKGLNAAKPVNGRLECVYSGDFKVYVDYAHTPDGLKKALDALKDGGRVICVFGCGGNRDKTKRKIMGEISGEKADFTVITSDNPRYEEPFSIIKEIEDGVIEKGGKYVVVEDRAEAVKYALSLAKSGDNILIAGKGAENYQEVLGVKKPFSDKETVLELIKGKGL